MELICFLVAFIPWFHGYLYQHFWSKFNILIRIPSYRFNMHQLSGSILYAKVSVIRSGTKQCCIQCTAINQNSFARSTISIYKYWLNKLKWPSTRNTWREESCEEIMQCMSPEVRALETFEKVRFHQDFFNYRPVLGEKDLMTDFFGAKAWIRGIKILSFVGNLEFNK